MSTAEVGLIPKVELYEAPHNFFDLYIPFLQVEEGDIHFQENKNRSRDNDGSCDSFSAKAPRFQDIKDEFPT